MTQTPLIASSRGVVRGQYVDYVTVAVLHSKDEQVEYDEQRIVCAVQETLEERR